MALNVGELYASFGIDTSGVDKALANIESKFSSLGRNLAVTGAAMTAAITAPLVKVGKDIYKTGTDFGEAMSRVYATADLDKSLASDVEQMEQLRAKALEMGSTTKFTASESAEALNYMAMAGWNTEQMLAGLPSVMNLAAASGEELGSVSDIVTDALTAFGLKAEDANHFADVLAKASSSANTNVGLMGNTFKYVAPLAGAMNYTIDDMAVAIGLMANAGIKGEMAGTQLRNVITGLVKPTEQQEKAMKKYGVSLKRQDGTLKSFAEVVDNLRDSMQGLTETEKAEVAATFGGARGMSGLLAIANATDEEIQALTESIQNCDGAAERMAKIALDNAAGDLVYFKSAVDGAKVSLWGLAEGPFRKIIQQATSYVTSFNAMDDATKQGVLRFAAFTAAIGPATAALGGLVAILPKLAKGMRLLVSPLGFVSLGLLALGAAAMDSDNSIGKTMENISAKIGEELGKAADYVAQHKDELAKNAGQFLDSFYKSVEEALPNFLQLGADLLVTIMDGIALNMPKIVEIALAVVENIRDSIVNNAPQIVPAALQLLQNLLVGMIESIPTVIGSIGEIALAIGTELANYDWKQTGIDIWTAIKNAFNEAVANVTNIGNAIKEKFGEETWAGVGTDIWESIKSGFVHVSGWLKGVILGDELNESSTWFDVGDKIWGWIKSGFVSVSNFLKNLILGEKGLEEHTWVEVGSSILDSIKRGFKTTGDWIKKAILGDAYTPSAGWMDVGAALWGKIKEGLKQSGDWLKSLLGYTPDDSWSQVGTDIWNVIKKGFEIGSEFVNGLFDTITGALSSFKFDAEGIDVKVQNAGAFVTNLANKLLETTANNYEKVGTFVTNLAKGIADWNGWGQVGETLGTVAGNIVSGIADAIPAVITNAEGLLEAGLNLGGAILDGIVKAITSMEESGIGIKLAEAAKKIINSLLTSVVDFNESNAVTNFLEKLGDAMITAGGALGNVLGDLVVYLLSPEGLSQVFEAGKSILKVLANGMTAAVMGIGSFVGNFIDKLLAGLGLTDPAAQEEFRKSGAILTAQVQAGMEEGFKEGSAGFAKTALLAAVAVRSGVAGDVTNGTIYQGVVDALQREFNSPAAKKSIEDLKSVVYETLSVWNGEDWVTPDFSDISDEMWQALYDAIQSKDWTGLMDFLNIGAEDLISSDTTQEIEGWAEAQEKAIEEATAGVKSKSKASMADAAGEGAKAMTQTILDEQGPIAEAAQADAEAAAKEFMSTLSAEEGTAIAVIFTDAIKNSFAAAQVDLVRTSFVVGSAVISTFQSVLTSSVGYNIGYMFGEGMANGIGSAGSLVENAAIRIGQETIAALKETLDEHSPSRVAEKIGQYFGIGYGNGVEDEIKYVSRTATKLGEASNEALSAASNGYGQVSHNRLSQVTATTSITKDDVKAMIKADQAAAKAATDMVNKVSEEASVTPRSAASSAAAQAAYSSMAVAAQTGTGANGTQAMTDLNALIETYARLVATALNGVTVELEGEEVGSLVAPVVSEIIAENAMARSNGTV